MSESTDPTDPLGPVPDDPALAALQRLRQNLHGLMQPLQVISGRIEMVQRQMGILVEEVPLQGPSVRSVLRASTLPAECILALVAIVAGIVFMAPGDTLLSAPGYRFMLALLPDLAWGALLLAFGTAHAFAIFMLGRPVRRGMAGGCIVMWVVLTGLFLLGNPIGLGWVLALPYLIASFWIVSRGPS